MRGWGVRDIPASVVMKWYGVGWRGKKDEKISESGEWGVWVRISGYVAGSGRAA